MSNRQKDKRYEFVKLCIALTKQGLTFTKGLNYTLRMAPIEFKRLSNPFLKKPFMESYTLQAINSKLVIVRPNQWADRT